MAAVEFDQHFPWGVDGDSGSAGQDEWRLMARYFGRSSGIVRGELNGGVVTVSGGDLHVSPMVAVVEGHYGRLENTAILTPAAPHASLDRIDLVVVRADFTNRRIETDILTGTPGADPDVPALTQSSSIWEFPDYRCLVAGGSGSKTLTPSRQIAGPGVLSYEEAAAEQTGISGEDTIAGITHGVYIAADRRTKVVTEVPFRYGDAAGGSGVGTGEFASVEVRTKNGGTGLGGAVESRVWTDNDRHLFHWETGELFLDEDLYEIHTTLTSSVSAGRVEFEASPLRFAWSRVVDLGPA